LTGVAGVLLASLIKVLAALTEVAA